MSAVVATIDLPAPPETVWGIVMDPRLLERWVTIHRELTSTDEGPLRVGFRMGQKYSIRGAPVAVSWTLQAFTAPRSAIWAGTGPAGATARIVYALTAIDGGTRFDYTNEFHAPMGVLGRVASKALMGHVPDREAQQSLERLKQFIAQD